MIAPSRTTAIVLAAGLGSRFGGRKVLAPLADRRVVDHVLDTIAEAGIGETVVVAAPEDAPAMRRAGVRIVVNPRPADGLSSSLRIGLAAAASPSSRESPDAILVVLADQPLLRAATIAAILGASVPAGRSFVVARHAGGGGPNPVLVLPSGWPAATAVSGDRGLGPFLSAHPELVVEIPVDGTNPDVDTPADLALVDWAERVRQNRDQVDRVREVGDGDFYATTTRLFVADPRRSDADDPTLATLRSLARPGERWLDIGAGAGRYALPLALAVGPSGSVVAVEASPGMLAGLRAGMTDHGITNVAIVEGRWPDVAATLDPAAADVSLIAHVGYDIEAVGPFLDAMERATKRLCVAVMMDRPPATIAELFWPTVHDEARRPLPALEAFGDLLRARGRAIDVRVVERTERGFADRDEALALLRRQTWVAPDGERDRRLQAALDERLIARPDGTFAIAGAPELAVGVVTWSPPSP